MDFFQDYVWKTSLKWLPFFCPQIFFSPCRIRDILSKSRTYLGRAEIARRCVHLKKSYDRDEVFTVANIFDRAGPRTITSDRTVQFRRFSFFFLFSSFVSSDTLKTERMLQFEIGKLSTCVVPAEEVKKKKKKNTRWNVVTESRVLSRRRRLISKSWQTARMQSTRTCASTMFVTQQSGLFFRFAGVENRQVARRVPPLIRT